MNAHRKKTDMRLLTFFLIFLLILTACAVPPATSNTSPTAVPVKPTTAPATFESSLLAVTWRDGSEGIFLAPLDPASGISLPGYTPISFGQIYFYAFSPDRRTLAAVIFPLNDSYYNGSLLLIDLPAWKTQKFDLKLSGWVNAMVFSPDGRRLVIAHGESTYRLTIFDLEQGVITAQQKTDSFVTRLKFTADGESLMLYRPAIQNFYTDNELGAGPPQVLLLDAADLSPRWSAELVGVRDGILPKDEKTVIDLNQPGTAMYLSPALAFAPDRDALYVVQADSEQLTTIDFSTQKVETVEIQTKLSWFERLLSLDAGVAYAKIADGTGKQAVISPDGQFLYVVGINSASVQDQQGNWQISQTPLGLEIIDTSDGSRVMHIETDAADLSLSPDGHFLYLRNWEDDGPWTEVFDTSSRQITTRQAGIYATPALRMNGEPLLVSTYSLSEVSHRMGIFQPDGLRALIEWTGPDYIAWLTPQ